MEMASPLRANAVLCTLTHTLLRLSPKFSMSSQTYSTLESEVGWEVSREVTWSGKEKLHVQKLTPTSLLIFPLMGNFKDISGVYIFVLCNVTFFFLVENFKRYVSRIV